MNIYQPTVKKKHFFFSSEHIHLFNLDYTFILRRSGKRQCIENWCFWPFYFGNTRSTSFDSGRLDTGVEKMAASAATASSSPGLCPNYAVICSFLERYGALLDLPELTFPQLERYLLDTSSGRTGKHPAAYGEEERLHRCINDNGTVLTC